MRIAVRPWLFIGLLLMLTGFGVNGFRGTQSKAAATQGLGSILYNQYGAVVQDANGQRINYSREQLEAQEAQYRANHPLVPPAPETAQFSGPEASWSYATFESGIGLSGIITAQNGPNNEIYSAGGFNSYWIALRHNPATNDYDQVYVSPVFSSPISRIRVADVVGDSAKEIIVATQDGHIYLYDLATKALLGTITTAANVLSAMDVAPVDGDGVNKLVLCTSNHLYVYSGAGVLDWDLAGVGGTDLVIAQMDTDPALEIALTDGHVVDCGTHLPQWTWAHGFGVHLAAADVDGHGIATLFVAESWQFVWGYDVVRQLPKWSISTSQDIGALFAADIEGTGAPDLLVGQGQWGSVIAFDPLTQQQKWAVTNPNHGVTNIAVGDVDGDGAKELLWGAGATDSGPDHLFVANWQTKQIKWQNIHLDGPFVGPVFGDLDGDGRPEMVVVSTNSESGYSSGRILVFDAATRRLRAISSLTFGGAGFSPINDVKLRDLNGDGKLEILVAAERSYNGAAEIYGFDTSNHFTLIWSSSSATSSGFRSIDVGDINNSGQMQVLVGSDDGYLRTFSYATGNLTWQSLYMRGPVTAVAIADVNNDGTKELIGMVKGGDLYIFDGPSKTLEALPFGPFTAMQVQTIGGIPSIALGDATGDLMIYRFSSGSYVQAYRQKLITTSVDGFTVDPHDRVWIGSSAVLYGSQATLTEVSLDGTVQATYSGYGSPFGLHVAFDPANSMFFTTGIYSVNAYPLQGAPVCSVSLQSTSQHFALSGGAASVIVAAGSTCDWGAVSNATWITINSATGFGNGTVQYTVSPNTGVARMGTMNIAGATFTVTQDAAPNYLGFIDHAACDTITGWAADKNRLNTSINVQIYDGTTLVTTVLANALRSDVGGALGDNGLHGFSIPTPAPLNDGNLHTVHISFEMGPTELIGSPTSINCGAPNYIGFVDHAGCDSIYGWAADRNRPSAPINVQIYDGTNLIAVVAASIFRPGVDTYLGDNGKHGFVITTPAGLQTGAAHSIHIKFETGATELSGSPGAITCTSGSTNYVGFVDHVGCDTIFGWTADRNRLNNWIVVSVYDGSTLIATLPAAIYRPGVDAFLGDNGKHGFSMVTPPSLKTNTPHNIHVRFETGGIDLTSSPASLTCP